ncbi:MULTISPECIES: DUF1304 domain-containing protein [Lactobacillus]|uniref:DUF1304 domain-containing protein n=1 Tax=Lactobacillus xujianguonis TaxID=2495899 RepID=A0A437SV42_9LACO|nr:MULTISPECIES: DUF1304 domain-containing protein [Lactobacillus]RVU70687.1 DUF1304 domain-containing protein [Lactobacillus xujianguonis]RVU77140.1 DUF1304 domain-containing protein [Lactobacillus xujianguonis]
MEANPILGLDLISLIVVIIVALEHIGIGLFEIFGRDDRQAKAFDMPRSFTSQAPAKTALANQGIYNLMLGILIFACIFLLFPHPVALVIVLRLLMIYIMIVAIFGGITATKKILLIQLAPALIALILLFF